MKGIAFGPYIQRKRLAAGLSLRRVAGRMKITHVYLHGVERGSKRPFPRARWNALIAAIPGLKVEELAEAALISGRMDVRVAALTVAVRTWALQYFGHSDEVEPEDYLGYRDLMEILAKHEVS